MVDIETEGGAANPQCPSCGKRLPDFKTKSRYSQYRNRTRARKVELTTDDNPPTYGSFGDNLVCNMKCGHKLLVKLAKSIGVKDMLNLLPPDWRMDLAPVPVKKISKAAKARQLERRRQDYAYRKAVRLNRFGR